MRTVILLSVFVAMMSAGEALAGTFCVVGMAVPPQCMYDDVPTCQNASSPPNTYCDVNPDARLTYYGSQQFCSVQSDRLAQCMFASFRQCAEAALPGTVCIDRGQAGETSPSPFRYDLRARE